MKQRIKSIVKTKSIKRIALIFMLLALVGISSVSIINQHVLKFSMSYIFESKNRLPQKYCCIVLGAKVYKSGGLSVTLKDRVEKSLELYKSGKIKRFLLSGDHGRKNYDEVNNMKDYLVKKGVAEKDIFLDHAGFNTYNSMVRAKKVFQINNAIIVTQRFHLPRAVYIARKAGIDAYGYVADRRKYVAHKFNVIREMLARVKSFFEVQSGVRPRYLGKKIPITGDSRLSYD